MELFGYWAAYVIISAATLYALSGISFYLGGKISGLGGVIVAGVLVYVMGWTTVISWICLGFYMIGRRYG